MRRLLRVDDDRIAQPGEQRLAGDRVVVAPEVVEDGLGEDRVLPVRAAVDDGLDPVGSSPAEFAGYIKTEIAKWARVIKAAGVTLEK